MTDTDVQSPVVYTKATLDALFTFLLSLHTCSILMIVCSDREMFLAQLLASARNAGQGAADVDDIPQRPQTASVLRRTLRVLSGSQSIDLAYCDSVSVLRAYLSTRRPPATSPDERLEAPAESQLLYLLNPIALHRNTSSYSAQGLSNTFAMAVEAAYRQRTRLYIVECASEMAEAADQEILDHQDEEFTHDYEDSQARIVEHEHHENLQPAFENPWDCELPILNVTNKAFRSLENSAWTSRKAKAYDIVGRWCSFKELPRA